MSVEMPKELAGYDFTPDQKKEIVEGLEVGVDTSLYARPEFMAIQMRQIKMGLMEGVDVTIYADPAYDWFQMEQLRKGLNYGLDVESYASPDIPYDKMRQVRKGLRYGIDISPYLSYSAGILREIRRSKRDDVDIMPYVTGEYDDEQLEQIRLALNNGVDLGPYLDSGFRGVTLEEIRLGLENGVDVSHYAKITYNWMQMKELRIGLEKQLDVSKYQNPLYTHKQMREIRLGLESGLPVDGYCSMRFSTTDMYVMRTHLLKDMKNLEKSMESAERDKVLLQSSEKKEEQDVFELVFTPNDMEVYLVIKDPENIPSEENILSSLWSNKVRKGIQRKVISDIANGVNKERNVLVASGQPPRVGEDGWYEFFIRIDIDRKPKMLEDGTVDYQNIEWFETVSAGDKLAYYHAAEDGVDGFTVRGDPLPARKGKEKGVLKGFGFNLESDKKTYVSAVDGWANYYNNRLEVSSMLEVEETTMATGNIVFNGSVHVKGNVGSQTEIRADGDILVDGFVESAVLESGGSIILRQGMNAAGQGSVKAGGDIVAKFFEATTIQAGGKIEANYCMNCDVETEDVIQINGNLVGGRAHAVKGLTVRNLGNRAAVNTYVQVGISDALLNEHGQLTDVEKGIAEELVMLSNALVEFDKKYPMDVKNEMEVYRKLKNAIYTKEQQKSEIEEKKREIEEEIKEVANAKIIVSGRVYEGVLAEVNGRRWISRFMMDITIRRTTDDKIAVYKN
ncbi:MAG: FapA family protein [Candidatus Gastranaerophilales bacterium]|nr:FapA family protein [Candidatus Gastranaerophilales bacterium]